MKLSDKINR